MELISPSPRDTQEYLEDKQKTEETIPPGAGSLEQAEQSKKLKDRANNDKEFFNNLNIPVETVQTKSRPSVEGQEVLPFVQNLFVFHLMA